MALLINKIPWTQQPQAPVGIDWSNPVTKGLLFASSVFFRDVKTGLSPTSVGNPVFTPTAYGVGATFSGSSSGTQALQFATGVATDIFRFGGTLHILVTVGSLTLTGNGNSICGKNTSGTAGWALKTNSAGKVQFLAFGTGTDLVLTGSTTLASGTTYLISVITPSAHPYASGSARIFINGIDDTSSSTATTGPSTTDLSIPLKFGSGGNGTSDWSGKIVAACFFNRPQSLVEIKNISQNLWQIFQPLQRRIFVSIPSGGLESIFSDNFDYYSIRGLIDSSVNPNYNIRTFTQTDKSSVFNVRTNTAIDNSVTYVLRNLVQTNAASGYNVRGNASLDASANYKIRTTSDNINVASYSIRAIVNNINNASYNLRGIVSSDKSSAFNVRGLAANSLGIVYNLRGSAYSDSLNNYTILSASSVSAAVTAVYNLRNLVNNTTSSSFNINSNVTQSILDEYKVRTSALSNNSNNYNIRGNVLRDIISNYQINPAVQYVYSDLNCYYNIITSMISPNEVARVKIYPSRLITTYDVERVKRIIA